VATRKIAPKQPLPDAKGIAPASFIRAIENPLTRIFDAVRDCRRFPLGIN
jgi:hypothetical protein